MRRGLGWCTAIPVLAISVAAASDRATATTRAGDRRPFATCPATRAHIEPDLRTRPEDGDYYRWTRKAVHKKIAEMIRVMGGRARVRAFANVTRATAMARLNAGAAGAERRYRLDAILRASALIAILDCLEMRR